MPSRRASIRAAARRRRRHRHRHLWTVGMVVVAIAVLAPALVAAAGGWPSGGAEPSPADQTVDVPVAGAADPTEEALAVGEPDDDGAELDVAPKLASVEGILLLVPGDPVVVGYHEASSDQALEFAPIGQVVANNNATKFSPPPDAFDGVPYLVLSSRGRPFPATSAVDVVLRDGEAVVSPVTGTVTDVRAYDLYGTYADERVEIMPDAAPDLRVVLVHLDGLVVAEGARVIAGTTPIAASGRRFGFSSQIDRETEPERHPHVHLEVKRAE